jgi:hypothetical protein
MTKMKGLKDLAMSEELAKNFSSGFIPTLSRQEERIF